MKLKSIKIYNYKSIDEITIPVIKQNNSNTTIFLGKNETGKSNILDALSVMESFNEKENIDFLSVRNQKTEENIVSVFYSFESENNDEYRKKIAEEIIIPDEILNKIVVQNAEKEIYITKGESKYNKEWKFTLKPFVLNNKFYIVKTVQIPGKIVNNIQQPSIKKKRIEITSLSEIKNLTEDEKSKYIQLTKEKLEEFIYPILCNYYNNHEIPISIWKSNPNYLIQDSISLNNFAEKPNSYPPLKNIFALSGYDSTEKIQEKIKEIAQNSNYRRRLATKLANETTKYLNNKWAEHKIAIAVEISDELNIHVTVQDKDSPDTYYFMSDRSQGFKHFVSLLLSLSINNNTGSLKNNLILIDEPEVHLHPSGIRYMLKELIEIGKNNYVFIATHSNFMIDRNTKNRHFIVFKKGGITEVNQISSEEDLNNDEVLQAAFGLNVIRDFLSNDKLLVEGVSDKILIQKALNVVAKSTNNCFKITNGKGDNILAVASLAAYYDIYPLVIVDDDSKGQNFKKEILKIGSGYNNENVVTIRELCASIKANGTIEDTLPCDYITLKTNEILAKENIEKVILDENLPFCNQIKQHLQKKILENNISKKEKNNKIDYILFDIKKKISDDFDSKNLNKNAPLLCTLAEEIIKKFCKRLYKPHL